MTALPNTSTVPAPRLRTDLLINVLSQALIRLLSLAYVILLAHKLGAAGLGKIAYAFSLFEMTNALVDLGCAGFVLREVPPRRQLAAGLLRLTTRFRFFMGLFLYGATAWLLLETEVEPETRWAALALSTTLFLNSYNNSLKNLMTALGFARAPAVIGFFVTLGGVASGALCTLWDAPLFAYTLVLAAWSIPDTLLTRFWAGRTIYPLPTGETISLIAFLRAAIPLGLNTLGLVCYYRLDTVLLKSVASSETVGLYNAGLRVVGPLALVLAAGLQPLASRAALLSAENPEALSLLIRRLFVRFAAGILLLALGLVLGAPWIVRGLYGPAFDAAIPLFRWLSVSLVLQGSFTVFNLFLVSSGVQNTRRALVAIFLGLLLNAVLFVSGLGAWGAEGVVLNRLISDGFLFLTMAGLVGRFLCRAFWLPAGLVILLLGAGLVALAYGSPLFPT